jgi:hypothetical protein
VRFKSGDPFAGVCINIRRRGVDTSILLRAQLTRVGTEMYVKVFSPTVVGIEVVQRAEKRARRARLYYMRYVPFDWFGLLLSISSGGAGVTWGLVANGSIIGNRNMIVVISRVLWMHIFGREACWEQAQREVARAGMLIPRRRVANSVQYQLIFQFSILFIFNFPPQEAASILLLMDRVLCIG